MSIQSSVLRMGDGYSEALSSVANLGKAAGSYANSFQNAFGKGKGSPSRIRALYTNGYFSQDKLFVPKFFVRAFDEPTYLTFRIEFITDPSENSIRNLAYNNAGVMSDALQSAMYATMYDNMPEPFLEDYSVIGKSRDSSLGRTYSSEAYLDLNLGDHGRAALLHNFKDALKDIEENFPFYFKSISGLSSLTTVDPKRGARLKDAKITIECEEGLDLKITQLVNMYRKIVWDDTYQRWILPDMMRYFGMRIYISEIRLFHDMRSEMALRGNGTYDFSDDGIRNAYSLPLDKSKLMSIENSAISTGTAVSNAYLGTRSTITKALNAVSGAITAGTDVISGVTDILSDVMLCNSAINEVLPTICLECHMCEFDISNTMNKMDSLHSNTHDSRSPMTQSITIKVGQVKEKQSYPLNKYLSVIDGKYGHKKPNVSFINDFATLYNQRDHGIGYTGQFVSDDILNKKYRSAVLSDRIDEYNTNLEHEIGITTANKITRKRLGPKMNDELETMEYSPEGSPESLAKMSLAAAALNEVTDVARRNGLDAGVFGTDSLALNQDKHIVDNAKAYRETMQEAADRIYNGSEIKSLAVSDRMKSQIADSLFDDYMDHLEESAESGSTLSSIVKAYKQIRQDESMPLSTATTKKPPMSNFSIING